jgi:uncharacterized protein (DUF1501 family)
MKREPILTTRRDFLRTGSVSAALTWTVPAFLGETFAALQAQAADGKGKNGSILVVLQMAGGNDGLNTVAPFTNDHYHKARPRLGFKADDVLKINDEIGLNPALVGFKALYDEGALAVVQGIGYPNPNRSHFRSTEIWATASDSNRFEKYGWLGRYFDNHCAGADPTVAISIGRQSPQSFAARHPLGVSFDNPQSYRYFNPDRPGEGEMDIGEMTYEKLNAADAEHEIEFNSGSSIGGIAGTSVIKGSPLEFLHRTAMDAEISSDKVRSIADKAKNTAKFPSSQLGGSLGLVSRLIAGGMPTRIYYVSQGGYDTHTNQRSSQDRLHKDLGDSVKAFVDDLKAQGNFGRVTLMTFSEFGRRVGENASGGTDHGSASVMFAVGQRLKGGLHGKYPSLAPADLKQGDLVYTTDFRGVYAGLIEDCLGAPSAPILGKQIKPLHLLRA